MLSELEGLLEIVSLETRVKSVGAAVHIRTAGGREFQISGAATLKLRTPNEVRTVGRQSRLAFDKLREQVGR